MQQIGRYRLVQQIGRGGMGVVFLAEDPKLGRQVAIKTIAVGESTDAQDWQWLHDRLLVEANRAASLDHPGIVTVYDVIDEGETAYIVMEYVSGASLDKKIAAGPLSRDEILNILRQLADALDYAHRNNIIHRDIKPGNIMINDAGVVKIADFGIAQRMTSRTIQTSGLPGTLEYMSPEQFKTDAELDGRADQYSLAVVAYMLIAGRKPFGEAKSLAELSQRMTQEPERASRFKPDLPHAVDAVLKKGLAKDRNNRFVSCAAFAGALERALLTGAGPDSSSSKRMLAIAAAVVAGLLVIFATAAALLRHRTSEPVRVAVSPAGRVVRAAETVQFRAGISGTSNTEVLWTVAPGVGSISPAGVYSAPQVIEAPQQVRVTVSSAADRNASASVDLTLLPSPPAPAAGLPLRLEIQKPEKAESPETVHRAAPSPILPVRSETRVAQSSAARFRLSVLAGPEKLASGASFAKDDPRLMDLGWAVEYQGAAPNTPVRIEWWEGTDLVSKKELTIQDSKGSLRDLYDNRVWPGSYAVKLIAPGSPPQTVSFTVRSAKAQTP